MSGFKSAKQRRFYYGQKNVPREIQLKLKDKHSDRSNHVKFVNFGDNKSEKKHVDHIIVEKAKNGKIMLKSTSIRNGKTLVKIVN